MSKNFSTPGPRDSLITADLNVALSEIEELVTRSNLEEQEAPERLSRYLATVIQQRLHSAKTLDEQAEIINAIVGADAETELVSPPQVWTGVRRKLGGLTSGYEDVPSPEIPLGTSDLLINGEGQPNIGSELTAELASAENVDLICAFVIVSGVNRLRAPIQELISRGGRFRIITTTYMGATQRKALDELVALGAEVRVAYDARSTKLHAKAWLLERSTGLSTAYVGSSNLSHTALFDGLEWNVRLSSVDAPHVIERVRTAFASHWESSQFEPYDPVSDWEKLDKALGVNRGSAQDTSERIAHLDVSPLPHQVKILETLEMERERHDRHRNLVVAATGTGKTIVAALDYRNLIEREGRDLSLLFVAHRVEILDQSLSVFRTVMKDGSFGEIHGGGAKATGRHVFAMIQSLGEVALSGVSPSEFDVVIVDEFHHASAPSYDALLSQLEPLELLGLTATPERSDGADITKWFDGRVAFEMRLWEAIEEGLLAPFQYFGVADGTDLSQLTWRGGYSADELNNVFTGDHARVSKLLRATERVLPDLHAMKALGFCVSVDHAHFMARQFTDRGLAAEAIDAKTSSADRRAILDRLKKGALRAVFSVDVLGEGVDVPNVDTILLLRPTDSATVFTQQLGRGLRQSPGKSHLTVIDLVGQQHRNFKFERRIGSLVDARKGPLTEQIKAGFPYLPSGCFVELDRQAEETVLESLKSATTVRRWATMVTDLKGLGDISLSDFLRRTDRNPRDLYLRGSWTELRRAAGLEVPVASDPENEKILLKALGRMLHIDDAERVGFYHRVLECPKAPRESELSKRNARLLTMLHFDLWSSQRTFGSIDEGFGAVWAEEAVRLELLELLLVSDARSETLTRPSSLDPELPLSVHAAYTRDEVMAALDLSTASKREPSREGVRHVRGHRLDIFLVTLHKTEKQYSATTMYKDFAISRNIFHWESQAQRGANDPTIKRYERHEAESHKILLFVREKPKEGTVTLPFTFAGPMTYESSTGERPVAFRWRLESPLPEKLFEVARSVAA